MRFIPILLAAALTASAHAQAPIERRAPAATEKRPMTFEDLQAMRRVSDPQISPSGKWVMFSVMDVDLARNSKTNHLWIVPADGSAKEHQLTFGSGESNGRFSPDGSRFVFVSGGQIWIAAWTEATGTMAPGVQLTHLVTEVDAPVWSPDGQSLAFVSEIYPKCSTGFLFDEACNQKATDDAAAAPTKALVFDSLLYRHWNLYQGAKRSHILMLRVGRAGYIYDLTPTADWGDNIIAPTFSLGGASGYAWAPDSKELAFVLNADKVPAASTNNDIYTIDVTQHDADANDLGKGWSPKKISTSPGSDDAPAYSPDGKFLAFRSQARAGYESDRFRLMLYDRANKTTREVSLKMQRLRAPETPISGTDPISPDDSYKTAPEVDLDRWVDEFLWSKDSQRIFFTASEAGQEVIFRTNVPDGNLHRFGRYTGAKTMGEWSELFLLGPGDRLGGVLMRADKPAELAVANLPEMDEQGAIFFANVMKSPQSMATWNLRANAPPASPNFLTHLNDQLDSLIEMAPLEPFTFPGANGTKVEGFLIPPPNFDPSKKYPLKFLIHGGPQGAWGDAWSYRWNAELMAASGYVVVMINPRGSTGYGQAFVDGVNGDWGGKPYVDLMRGLDYAESHFSFIDKKRECALGASYGGYMANWILTHTNRFACIVTHDGMFNPQSAYGTTEELWFNEWEFRRPGSAEPGQPWRYAAGPLDADPFRKWSPMLSIQNAKTPTLVIHSQRDYRLDVSEGFQLFTALQRLGVPSKMLYFPDEGHWILKPQNSKLWYETVSDWCDRYTHTNKYANP